MPRSCCARVFDAACPCFRRWSSASTASSGGAFGSTHDMSLNFILHGECNVGKTSLRNRWVDGIFTGDVAPTFGVDFNIKTLDLVQEEEEEGEEEDGQGEEDEEEAREEGWSKAGAVADETQRGVEVGGQSRKKQRPTKKKQVPCADLQVKINVYDTSGKPGYREVNSTYLLAFDAVLFVYDISSMATLDVSARVTCCTAVSYECGICFHHVRSNGR